MTKNCGCRRCGRYRPTITRIPKTGETYLRSLLTAIEPGAVLSQVFSLTPRTNAAEDKHATVLTIPMG